MSGKPWNLEWAGEQASHLGSERQLFGALISLEKWETHMVIMNIINSDSLRSLRIEWLKSYENRRRIEEITANGDPV